MFWQYISKMNNFTNELKQYISKMNNFTNDLKQYISIH